MTIVMTDAYRLAVLSSLRLYHSLALGRLDELYSMGAAAIIPAKHTASHKSQDSRTYWSDLTVIQFREALEQCMKILGHQTEDHPLPLRGEGKHDVAYDLQDVLRIETLIGLLDPSNRASSFHSVGPVGAGREQLDSELVCLQIDHPFFKVLLQALDIYTRMGYAQLEKLAYYVDDGLIPGKKGSSTHSRKEFYLTLERINSFKSVIGYSKNESAPFNSPAIDKSTHLCFELIKELKSQWTYGDSPAEFAGNPTVQFNNEPRPLVSII